MDITSIKFDRFRDSIREQFKSGKSWDDIRYLGTTNYNDFLGRFEEIKTLLAWNITSHEYLAIVEDEEVAHLNSISVSVLDRGAIVIEEGSAVYPINTPTSRHSAWQLYVARLRRKDFKEKTINSIEESTKKVLSQLKRESHEDFPVKGLVVGNVQSGKTANMAALIAMAADSGWNMFIVLSGTIDKLREQTEKRLSKDLGDDGNLAFQTLRNLSSRSPYSDTLQNLKLGDKEFRRYLYVCLKNSTVLKNLNHWINKDQKQKKNIKILVIDDEADQAGINTLKIDEEERTRINKAIINLIHNKDVNGKQCDKKFGGMNYIGYTATPYANILNESTEGSLYPSSFIATLATSNEYFGPQQIFGNEQFESDGLSIINKIDDKELVKIRNIHNGRDHTLPQGLEQAILWFYCSVAAMRYQGFTKSISMLIHTSQKQDHHDNVYRLINQWLDNEIKDTNKFLVKIESLWNSQTKQFDKDKLFRQYPNYDREQELVKDFPRFSEIKLELQKLLNFGYSNIMFDFNNDELVYNEGINICIDNCRYKGIDFDGNHFRVAYPDDNVELDFAPAFIIIGGSTLSRGLTIEGLISTYFLRSTAQADTLMQMGRWFGYRRDYEVYPRIWLTNNTINQFKFLSKLDLELRGELVRMERLKLSPSAYAPRVKNTPSKTFLRITSKNRMQSAEECDVDYSGYQAQTIHFFESKNILHKNFDLTHKFILSLGKYEIHNPINKHSRNAKIWRNIESERIFQFLNEFDLPPQTGLKLGLEGLIEWVNKMVQENKLANWNVIISGTSNGVSVDIGNTSINKVNRSQSNRYQEEGIINISALRDPRDPVVDIDLAIDQHLVDKFSNLVDVLEIREESSLYNVPQLVIYVIDKNSKVSGKDLNSDRRDLNLEIDPIGLFVNVPNFNNDGTSSNVVRVRLPKNDEEVDIDDATDS